MDKDYFRQIIKNRRNLNNELITSEDKESNRLIVARYVETDYYKNAEIIFAYSSFGKELSVQKIIHKALADGKRLALPKIISKVKDGAEMGFVFVDENTNYKNGVYNISEPANNDYIDVNKITGNIEMLVPGLCFDLNGGRIGYGGGYFDRYIAKFSEDKFHKTALIYDYQLFDELPVTDKDICVDLILSEKRYIDFLIKGGTHDS